MICVSRRNNNSLPTTAWCNYQLFLLYNIHKRITTLSYCMCAILLWIGWWWCYSTWSFHILWDLASARFYCVFFTLHIIEGFDLSYLDILQELMYLYLIWVGTFCLELIWTNDALFVYIMKTLDKQIRIIKVGNNDTEKLFFSNIYQKYYIYLFQIYVFFKQHFHVWKMTKMLINNFCDSRTLNGKDEHVLYNPFN